MLNYTAEQIREAIREINGMSSEDTVSEIVVWKYEKFISALPEPQQDWQECTWDDILHTDERVKAEYISGTVIEGIPDGISDEGIHLVGSNFMPNSTDARWYRIPAPVVAPDPAEHPVILIHRSSGIKHVPPAVAITRKNNMTDDIHYVFKDYGVQSPADITEWEPAKVVADDE